MRVVSQTGVSLYFIHKILCMCMVYTSARHLTISCFVLNTAAK